jgi:hypothetical protein
LLRNLPNLVLIDDSRLRTANGLFNGHHEMRYPLGATLMMVCTVTLSSGADFDPSQQGSGSTPATEDAIVTLIQGLRQDPDEAAGWRELSVDNSHIIFGTPRIKKVVAFGTKVLPALLEEMRRPDVSLDTFVRCYSACDQILRKAGLPEPVDWHGGLIDVEGPGNLVVRTSRLDGFSAKFRRAQIKEIITRANEIKINLGTEP